MAAILLHTSVTYQSKYKQIVLKIAIENVFQMPFYLICIRKCISNTILFDLPHVKHMHGPKGKCHLDVKWDEYSDQTWADKRRHLTSLYSTNKWNWADQWDAHLFTACQVSQESPRWYAFVLSTTGIVPIMYCYPVLWLSSNSQV